MLTARIDGGRVAAALKREGERRMRGAEALADRWAARMEDEAKRDAPWKDRTGLARQSIAGVSGRDGTAIVCGVSGGAAYSPALELADEGRGAVLGPVVRRSAEAVLADCAAAMR